MSGKSSNAREDELAQRQYETYLEDEIDVNPDLSAAVHTVIKQRVEMYDT